MEPIIGKRYKTTEYPSISERYRNRIFTVTDITSAHVHIRFEETNEGRTISRDRWNTHAKEVYDKPWHGNILKFHFT
jgi:hypothetical protein